MTVLIKTNFNCGDEFECQEFALKEDDDYELWLSAWERLLRKDTVEVNFGSNEFLQIMSFDDFKQGLEVTELTSQEVKMLNRLFPDGSWGTGGIFNFDDFDDEYFDQEYDEDFELDFDEEG